LWPVGNRHAKHFKALIGVGDGLLSMDWNAAGHQSQIFYFQVFGKLRGDFNMAKVHGVKGSTKQGDGHIIYAPVRRHRQPIFDR